MVLIKFATKKIWFCLLLLALCGLLPIETLGTGQDNIVFNSEIAGPSSIETGVWRTKTQQVFDPIKRTLIRKMYIVWDATPSRNLDFLWTPDSFRDDTQGKINGYGSLIWRIKGKPVYDPTSIFAKYRGYMKEGRADGHGTYFDISGMTYKGEWKNGTIEGQGILTLPSGDEYIGYFRAGKANGPGRYVDLTGEIFEGNFLNGLREGRGRTTLANGRSYQSTWLKGTEIEFSRLLRVAQASGPSATDGSDEVRLGVTVDRALRQTGDLRYIASNTGPRLVIRPDNTRLMDMWKGGGEIQLTEEEEQDRTSVLFLESSQLPPLTLVLEVQNRSSNPLQISGAYVEVENSITDLQPAIELSVGSFDVCSGEHYRPRFRLSNFGWSPAMQAEVRFAFANPLIGKQPATGGISKRLGDIVNGAEVNLEADLQAAGVKTNILRSRAERGLACKSKDPANCLQELKASGIFGTLSEHIELIDTNIVVSAIGSLRYNWRASIGSQKSSVSPFKARLLLGHVTREVECGEGGERESIASIALSFRLDQSNYRLPIAFQRSIPAGRTSRLTFPLQAAKSSEHDFRVVLQLADGREITSRPINLLYYVPKRLPGS